MSSDTKMQAQAGRSVESATKAKKSVLVCILLLASAMATSGCMLTPGDGQNIGSESSLIYFTGYTTKPNTRVYVRARDSLDSQWIHLGTAYSSSTPLTLDGLTGYPWNTQLTIPQSAWSGCGSNRSATVRAHAYQGTLSSDHAPITIVADGVGCWISNPNWGSFINNCIAENSPDAIIYSNDGPRAARLPVSARRSATASMTTAMAKSTRITHR